MRVGLTVSLMLHLALIGWAVGSISATEDFVAPPVPVIEAELVTVSEFTNLRKGDPKSKKMDAKVDEKPPEDVAKKEAEKAKPKAAPKPPPAAEPPPPAEPPEDVAKAEPEPPPVSKTEPPPPVEPDKPDPIAEKLAALPPTPAPSRPSAEERKKAAEALAKKRASEKKKRDAERKKRLAEQKKREEKARKLAEARKREEAKKTFDADRIAALLDKTPEKRGAPKTNANEPSQPTEERGPTAGERNGTGDALTAREQDLVLSRIQRQLAGCWNIPGAGGGVRIPVVVFRWQMRKDGSLDGSPILVSNPGGTLSQQAEEAARRAIYCVGRFDLPERYYNGWRKVEFAFDAAQMISGGY